MSKGLEALREWAEAVRDAPDGTMFQYGELYDITTGWRVFMSIGDKYLSLTGAQARKIADRYEEMARTPEYASQREWARDVASGLRESALAVVRKNNHGEVPDGYAAAMPVAGTA